jgi:hypothetical protein
MGFLSEINWALFAPLIVLQVILMAAALASCLRAGETNGPKGMWILIIIVVNIIGPVLYFVLGRKNG